MNVFAGAAIRPLPGMMKLALAVSVSSFACANRLLPGCVRPRAMYVFPGAPNETVTVATKTGLEWRFDVRCAPFGMRYQDNDRLPALGAENKNL